jgi:hypothetical protein
MVEYSEEKGYRRSDDGKHIVPLRKGRKVR